MIIAGDLACPTAALSKQLTTVFETNASIFKNKAIVLNLEGMLGEEDLLKAKVPVLYNHPSVLDTLHSFSTVTACLANNHILDLPVKFGQTIEQLQKRKINYAGAGSTHEKAYAPATFLEDKQEVIVFNECWNFLLYHQKNPANGIHLATIQFHGLADRVEQCKAEKPDACIIIYLHWSLDLETLPYPMYRQFAQALINAGAAVVAGCHAHCVQGGEQYKQGYIVYGLGNFFLPNHVFANGHLFFPAFAATQLVLEYIPKTNKAICHWFDYKEANGIHSLLHLESCSFESSALMKKHSPYQQMSSTEYLPFFKKNRRKKVLIPLFKNYQNKRKLKTLTNLLKTRATFARLMARVKIIKWGS